MRIFVLIITLVLSGCFAPLNIPDTTPIHETRILLVAETVDIGRQTVYEDQELKHYKVDGQDVYCSELYSLDLKAFRCFGGEMPELTTGMDPLSFEKIPLERPILVKTVSK